MINFGFKFILSDFCRILWSFVLSQVSGLDLFYCIFCFEIISQIIFFNISSNFERKFTRQLAQQAITGAHMTRNVTSAFNQSDCLHFNFCIKTDGLIVFNFDVQLWWVEFKAGVVQER